MTRHDGSHSAYKLYHRNQDCRAWATPELEDFRIYFLIQGCVSTSVNGILSSGSYLSSCASEGSIICTGTSTDALDEIGRFGRDVAWDFEVDIADPSIRG